MTRLRDVFEENSRATANDRRRLDFDDLQNELAGLETGRIARHLSPDARDERRDARTGKNQSEQLSRLQMLLASDQAYAALYQETFDLLRDAEANTARALALAKESKASAEIKLNSVLADAAVLPDGTRVFRGQDGHIWSEHGEKIEPEDAAAIVWRGNEPSYEDYRAARERLEASASAVADIERYQVDVLGHVRDRLTEEDNPASMDELQNLQKRLQAGLPQTKLRLDDAHSVTRDVSSQPTSDITIPKL
ncbi:MAG: hypothetical protein AAF732_19385 [Pseudomonadota bacterium]